MSKRSKKPTKPPILNRYTSLPVLLDVLRNRHITLLSPDSWEDRNDAHYLERYQTELKLQSLLAICFSERQETFHQWRVFSSGSSGLCIEFDKASLIKCVVGKPGFRAQKVDYRWIEELKTVRPDRSTWPFLKRKPFQDEEEFRIIFESTAERLTHRSIPIDLSCIRLVTLSPWLPSPLVPAVIAAIKAIPDCTSLRVQASSILENTDWKKAID